jgi:hypothetical protein
MLLWGMTGWLACGPGGSGDAWTLNLHPRVLADQDPFADPADLQIGVRAADGTETWHAAGSTSEGELAVAGLASLDPDAPVALAFQKPGSGPAVEPSALTAWGATSVPEGATELDVVVARQADVGELDRLAATKARWFSAVALVGADAFVFGGTADPNSADEVALDDILHLIDVHGGDWTLADSGVSLPAVPDRERGRVGATATTVSDRGSKLVFVTGGRARYGMRGGSEDLAAAFLFDPVALDVVWKGDMNAARSEHRAVLRGDGRVVVIGSDSGGVASVTADVFDPVARAFTAVTGDLRVGPFGFDAVLLDGDDVLVCGGAFDEGGVQQPLAACDRITASGTAKRGDDLPEGRMRHALAALPGGDALVTGGVTAATASQEEHAAVATALRLRGNGWADVGDLVGPRAHHRAVGLADGRVVLIGGTETGGAVWPDPSSALTCTEVFDPDTESFSRAGQTCTDAGAGADPAVSTVESGTALVLAGWWLDGDPSGGRAYGLLGAGPW